IWTDVDRSGKRSRSYRTILDRSRYFREFDRMKIVVPFALLASLGATSACLAGAQDVSPQLRQTAIDNCSGDAMRLCPMAMSDEAAAVSCMADKRPQLTPSCRVVYDQVARVLKR
ncbi:MAG: hypothetical protein ACRYHQ_16360, partial [Janthinobacterium lividum]